MTATRAMIALLTVLGVALWHRSTHGPPDERASDTTLKVGRVSGIALFVTAGSVLVGTLLRDCAS